MEDQFKVLVIDDEEVIRNLIQDVLDDKGHYVRTASDGEEAVSILKQEKFDVLITDVKMPGMGGLELLQKAKKKYPDIVVIMMTGYGTIEEAVRAIKLGAAEFLTKPIREIAEIPIIFKKAMQFQKMQKEILALRELSKLHEEFLALISHELRTPLTSITGNLEAVTTLFGEQITSQLQEVLDMVANSAREMSVIVESLLLAADLQIGNVVLANQDVDLNHFLKKVLDRFGSHTENKKREIVFEPCQDALPVNIDVDLMGKALENIIVNSFKFNGKLPELKISVSTYREGNTAKFIVANDGNPVSPKQFDTIFRMFKQVDHYLTRSEGGLGLGLPITRAIMKKHDGDISIEQSDGKGMVLSLWLPLAMETPSGKNSEDMYSAGQTH